MRKILVVDDSEVVRTQLKSALTEQGFAVEEAEDGLQGLNTLIERPEIDLVICDVNMPEMDGLTMCEEKFKNPEISNIPVFMLTTQHGKDLKARGKQNGVVAWIIKPFNPNSIVNGINAYLTKMGK